MSKPVIRQSNAFATRLKELESEPKFFELAARLQEHPELGDVIPGTDGLRKIRMALPGKGSRGGARVIYLWLKSSDQILFLWIFTKGEAEDLNPKEKKALSSFARQIKSEHQDAKKKEKG